MFFPRNLDVLRQGKQLAIHLLQVNFSLAHRRADVVRDIQIEVVFLDLRHRPPP